MKEEDAAEKEEDAAEKEEDAAEKDEDAAEKEEDAAEKGDIAAEEDKKDIMADVFDWVEMREKRRKSTQSPNNNKHHTSQGRAETIQTIINQTTVVKQRSNNRLATVKQHNQHK
jgi:hypothetical protein